MNHFKTVQERLDQVLRINSEMQNGDGAKNIYNAIDYQQFVERMDQYEIYREYVGQCDVSKCMNIGRNFRDKIVKIVNQRKRF